VEVIIEMQAAGQA